MPKVMVALLTNNDDDVYCFRKELLESFVANGWELLVSCPDGPKFELLRDIPFIHDQPNIDRRGTNIAADVKLFVHYWRVFRKYKPTVVLTYTAKPNVYGGLAAWLLGIPYICNVTGLGSVLNKGAWMQRFILGLFRASYRRAACIMFQNDTNQALAQKNKMIRGEHRLIPGSGVALNRFEPQPYPDGGDGKTGTPVVFNYIGRILHDKGVDDYIAMAKRIKAEYPCTEFRMIGFIEPTEMHYQAELEELGRQGIIQYCGSQKDVRPFVATSHATIHPSTYGEGMSNVLLESAASARPLITTDNAGCRETVLDGVSGYIYHGGDVEALIGNVKKFLSLPNAQRRSMGEAGRRYIEENFSRKRVVEVYCEEIKKIL